jgi:hypothetical protein
MSDFNFNNIFYTNNTNTNINTNPNDTPPDEYKSQLSEMNTRFKIILDEYVELYPSYMLNSTYSGYASRINNLTDNFAELKNDIFLFQNSLEQDTTGLLTRINDVNNKLKELEASNTTSSIKYNRLLKSNNASLGAISYKREEYNTNLFRFSLLCIATLALAVTK